MRAASIRTSMMVGAAGELVAALIAPAAAAPTLSGNAALKAAAERPVVNVQCGLTGGGWSAAGLVGALRPGILAVGFYYNSLFYGYSGYPPYYGEGYPPYYGCAYGYPVYYAYQPTPAGTFAIGFLARVRLWRV
jgi:hypothetical protein